MDSEGMTTGEKADKLYTDVAVLAATTMEMSKRQDDAARSIEVLNHNSTEMKVNIARLESAVDKNTDLIKDFKNDLLNNMRIYLTVLGLFLGALYFAINYFKP